MAKLPGVRTDAEPPKTEADLLRQQITELREAILHEIRLGMVPRPRVVNTWPDDAAPAPWTLGHHHSLMHLQAELARKEAELELILLLRLEQTERAQQEHRARQLEQAGKRAQREQTERERMERRLRRLEEQGRGPPPARGYAADDRAIARMVLAEDAGRTASRWKLAKLHGRRLKGDGSDETKCRRLRTAMKRVDGK